MTSTTRTPSIYGDILDYQTADVIRPATREDWQHARTHGQPHTGVYADPTTGDTVYCDGPDEDPEPALAE